MTEKDREWEEYLLSIGVNNLDDKKEISSKLEEVEQANPYYQLQVLAALESMNDPLIVIDKDNIVAWLESLGD